jgi:hypothetical protein
MKVTWKKGLSGANVEERRSLLEAEGKAELYFAQELVGAMCADSDLGVADCSKLVVSCRTRRWCRAGVSLFSCIECVSAHPAGTGLFNWRLPRVPGTRACVRPVAK